MEGINILYMETVESPWVLGIIAGMFIFVIVFIIWCVKDNKKNWLMITVILVSLGLFTFSCYKVANNQTKQYWITLEESVTVKELDKNYDVIDQKGNILIVQEKE